MTGVYWISQLVHQTCLATATLSMHHNHCLAQGTVFVLKDFLIGLDQGQGFLASPTQQLGGGDLQGKGAIMSGLGNGAQALVVDGTHACIIL